MDSNPRYRIRNNPFWLPPFGPAIRLPQQKPALSCRGPFLEARKSSEKALIAVIQEAWIGGVSTRRVDDLVQAMGLSGISKSQVSKLCKEIDERVHAFPDRLLAGEWPYLWLDAKSRRSSMGHAPESQVRTRLFAGGRWILSVPWSRKVTPLPVPHPASSRRGKRGRVTGRQEAVPRR